MDWLQGMNQVITYIEENLTEQIRYETLARMVGCSIYEFSRIFSFLAQISVSEYIRRRRLSQAVFDLQNSDEKIVDIALKYCYESPTTFTRAFKELHRSIPGRSGFLSSFHNLSTAAIRNIFPGRLQNPCRRHYQFSHIHFFCVIKKAFCINFLSRFMLGFSGRCAIIYHDTMCADIQEIFKVR